MKKTRTSQERKDDMLEFRRKSFHLVFGLTLLVLVYIGMLDAIKLLALFFVGLAVSLISRKIRIPFIAHMLDWFERPSAREMLPGKGALMLVLGLVLALVLFPRDVALASIAIVTIGDSISHMVGRFGGSVPHPLNGKYMIEGSILGTFCAFLAAMLFVNPIEAFLAASISMLFEVVEFTIWKQSSIDDNIMVPMISGIVVMLARNL